MAIKWPGDGPPVRLQTRYSPEECWAQLESIAEIHRHFFPWHGLFARKPLFARRRGERLVLAAYQPLRYAYPFWFYGRIVADGSGSLIEGRFRFSGQQRAILLIMSVLWPTLLITLALFIMASEPAKPRVLGMLLLMLVLPFVLIWYNVGYAHRHSVLPLLKAVWDATEV